MVKRYRYGSTFSGFVFSFLVVACFFTLWSVVYVVTTKQPSVATVYFTKSSIRQEAKSIESAWDVDRTLSEVREPQAFSQSWVRDQVILSLKSRGIHKWPNNSWDQCKRKPQTYYFEKLKVIYTGVPKAGCSNWLEALCKADGRQIPQGKDAVDYIHEEMTSRDRIGHMEDTELATLGDIFSFTIVRNPWTRLVSGYRDKISDENSVGPNLKNKINVKMLIAAGIVIDEGAVAAGEQYVDFEGFIDYLIARNGSRNIHFKPQYFTLCLPQAGYDYIGALEYSDVHQTEIFKILNKSVEIEGSYDDVSNIRNAKTTLKAKEMFGTLPQDKIEKLYRLYKPDFLILNYSNFTDPNFPLPLYFGPAA